LLCVSPRSYFIVGEVNHLCAPYASEFNSNKFWAKYSWWFYFIV